MTHNGQRHSSRECNAWLPGISIIPALSSGRWEMNPVMAARTTPCISGQRQPTRHARCSMKEVDRVQPPPTSSVQCMPARKTIWITLIWIAYAGHCAAGWIKKMKTARSSCVNIHMQWETHWVIFLTTGRLSDSIPGYKGGSSGIG